MPDHSHLDALLVRLSHERQRLLKATSKSEIELRTVWVKGIEKEVAHEKARLGITDEITDSDLIGDLSDDELLKELGFDYGTETSGH